MKISNYEQYQKLDKVPSRTFILTMFILAHAVLLIMMLYTFPIINAKFATTAFDLKTFGYSESEAVMMLQNLDQSTINLYLFPQLFFLDILYPALLALLLSSIIKRLYALTAVKHHPFLSNLKLLPFIAMVCDYIENIMISRMITNVNELSSGLVRTASLFTQMKGAFTMFSWLIIVILSGIWIHQKWQARRDQNRDYQTQVDRG